MKKITAVLLPALLLLACNRNPQLSPNELEDKIKQTMQDYLDKSKDTSQVKFTVLKVIYYAAPNLYYCDFKVNMRVKQKNIDTIGEMKANIPKDFSKVDRTY